MYIFFPYLGTKTIHKIHATLSPHHVKYFRGIGHVDKKQAVLDWESARFTKPDKPWNAAETLMNKYPNLLDEFDDTFHELGLGGQLEHLLWNLNS